MPRSLLIAFVWHLLLAGFCLLRTPAFEAPGEADRLRAAIAVAQGNTPRDPHAALLGVTLRGLGAVDLEPIVRAAPAGSALRYLHGADEPAGSREQLTLLGLRAWSLLLGLLTLTLTWHLARLAFPREPGIATAAVLIQACVPQWAFSHGTLWAGALTAVATHAGFLLAVRGAVRGRFSTGDGVALGLALCLARGSDPHTWFVGVIVAIALFAARATRPHAATTLAAVGYLVGAWLAPAALTTPAGDRGVLALLVSFVGEFGDATVPAPLLPCLATVVLIALATVGIIVGGSKLTDAKAGLGVLFFSCSLGTMALARAGVVDGMSGRTFLLASGPMFVVTAAGLLAFGRRFTRRRPAWPLGVTSLIPFLPCATVLLTAYLPALRPEQARAAAPGFAAIQGSLRTGDARGIDPTTPPDAAVLAAPPTLAWRASPSVAGFVVTGWTDDGRVVFTSFDAVGASAPTDTWTLPADTFAALPAGATIHWRVRALAHRTRGEASAAMPGSGVRTFKLAPGTGVRPR